MLTAGGNALGRTRFDGNGGAAACVESPAVSPPTLFFCGCKRQKRDVTARQCLSPTQPSLLRLSLALAIPMSEN